jgi:tetratricopeptide (TPR) repeat protein
MHMAPSELFQSGAQALKAGNYEEARRLFEENEAKAGTASATLALLQRAEGKLREGDLPVAATLFEQALDRNPSLTDAYLGLARVALFTGEAEAAKVHATAATRLSPRLGLSWTLLALAQESSQGAAAALELLKKGCELSPRVFLCQFNYGRALAAAGRPHDALAPLSAATTIEPGNPDAFYTLGMACKEAKLYERSLRAFERAKDLAPKRVDTWATLADVLFEVKEFQAARDLLDRGLTACGEHPALLEKALATAMMLEDAPGAIAYVERELKVVPEHEQAWLNLAGLCLTTKDFDRAEQAAKTLLEKSPKNWEAWLLLGNLYSAVPVEREAEQAFRKAVEHSQGGWKPLMNLATLLIESTAPEKHAEAVTLLEKAQAVAPQGEWRVSYNLALALVRLGQRDRAIELAQRIQREAPAGDAMVAEAQRLEVNLREAAG